jgi:hypothetical protein
MYKLISVTSRDSTISTVKITPLPKGETDAQDLKIYIIENLPVSQPFCYKVAKGRAWGFKNFEDLKQPTSWSHTMYCQLQSQLSLGYLPNILTENPTEACLFSLSVVNPNLKILLVTGAFLSKSKVTSYEKAKEIIGILQNNEMISSHEIDDQFTLMQWMGRKGFVFCGIDAEDYEVGIPEKLLTEENFKVNPPLTHFKGQHYSVAEWRSPTAEWVRAPKNIMDRPADLYNTITTRDTAPPDSWLLSITKNPE